MRHLLKKYLRKLKQLMYYWIR